MPPQPPPPAQTIVSRPAITNHGSLPPATADTTDIAAIWESAVADYERTTGTSLPVGTNLVPAAGAAALTGSGGVNNGTTNATAPARDVDSILALIKTNETHFLRKRHDGSRLDRFRTLVARCLGPVDRLRETLGHATKGVYPPAEAIFAAVGVLIAAVNGVSTDYDRVSDLFEDMDDYLHRLKVLEEGNVSLTGMPELRRVLVEVFVAVLGLCALATRLVKMNRVVKALRNLVSGQDADLKAAYERFHKIVEREGHIVLNETFVVADKTHKMMVDHRAAHQEVKQSLGEVKQSFGKVEKAIEDQESAEERESILTWLSTVDFHDKQKTTFSKHHKGTGQWFLDAGEFQEWFKRDENSILWCPGIPGAGKSVMVSTAVCYVEEQTEGSNVAIAYIYCDYKDPTTRSEGEIFRSIARQLVEQCRPVPPEAKAFRDKFASRRSNPALEDQVTLVQTLTRNFGKTYLFIDALDECLEETRETVLRSVGDLGDSIRLLITSRPHIDLGGRFPNLSRLDIVARQTDMEAYLKFVVESNRRMHQFAAKDPNLRTDITESIQSKADGMFLLAHLQIVHLCGQSSSKNVRKSLDTLSGGLSSFYEGAMGRVAQQTDVDRNLAKRAFSFIMYARRPLQVSELLEALSVEPGDTELDNDSLPELEIMLGVTAGMVRVDERTNVVGFVHYTVQQYLEADLEHLVLYPEVHVAETCLTYLSFDIFAARPCQEEQAVFERIRTHAFLRYCAWYGRQHWRRCQDYMREDDVLEFLQHDALLFSMLQVAAAPAENRTRVAGRPGWLRKDTCSDPPLHAAAGLGLHRIMHRILQGDVDIESCTSYGMTPLMCAVQGGRIESVQLLVDHGADVNKLFPDGETTIEVAARYGDRDVVDLLHQNGADPFLRPINHDGCSPLEWAIVGGHKELVHQILSYCRHPGEKENQKGLALCRAVWEGARELTQELLDDGAPIEGWLMASSPLTDALGLGHEKTAHLLIENGADVNARGQYGATPLYLAVGKPSLTRLILEKGADPDASDDQRNTPLHMAARIHQKECARELLRHGADPNLKNDNDFTPLHIAAIHGSTGMVRLLLENGADPNAVDFHQWKPLHLAALRGHGKIIRILCDASECGKEIMSDMAVIKADRAAWALMEDYLLRRKQGVSTLTGLRAAVNSGNRDKVLDQLRAGAGPNEREPVGTGDTALIIAACMGYTSIGLTLIEHGADVNWPDSDGRNPFYSAVNRNHPDFAAMLLQNGADIEAKYQGTTPLLLAVSDLNIPITEYLIDQGANVNAEDLCGRRSLHWATERSLLHLLIRKGADVNAQDVWGRTALMWAVETGYAETTTELLRYGANPNLAEDLGITPLHMAAYIGNEMIVRHLFSSGADCNAKDDCGMTALHVAVMMDYPRVADLLRARGANEGEDCRWRSGDTVKTPSCQMILDKDLYKQLWDTTREYLGLDKLPDMPGGYTVSDLVPIGQKIGAAREARRQEAEEAEREREYGSERDGVRAEDGSEMGEEDSEMGEEDSESEEEDSESWEDGSESGEDGSEMGDEEQGERRAGQQKAEEGQERVEAVEMAGLAATSHRRSFSWLSKSYRRRDRRR